MTAVYAVFLLLGFLALTAWMVAHSLAESAGRPERDPEQRLGPRGRRLAGGMVGFGMAGMSAQFAAIEIPDAVVFALSLAGAAAAAWWAGSIRGEG